MTRPERSREREGESTKRQNVDLCSRRERTLFALSAKHLVAIKIIGNDIESNYLVMKLPHPFMRMVELESNIFLLGGIEINVSNDLYLSQSNDALPVEIYEVKQHPDSVSIVPSKTIPNMKEGKGSPMVQKFGSKIFVLNRGLHLKYDDLSHKFSPNVFEVFDSAFPEKGWVVKSGIPFFDGSISKGGYYVPGFFRMGEKVYIYLTGKRNGFYVFNLKTEEWSEDDFFFWGEHSPLGSPVCAVSAPGLDDDTYVVFGFENAFFPEFHAALFTQGKGCYCYQNVDHIFNLEGLGRKEMTCQFVEMGNGDYLGLLTAREKASGFYLLVSTFSLEVFTTHVPPIPTLDNEPIKVTFLRVNRKSQQNFNISGADICYFVGAACV